MLPTHDVIYHENNNLYMLYLLRLYSMYVNDTVMETDVRVINMILQGVMKKSVHCININIFHTCWPVGHVVILKVYIQTHVTD